MGEHDEIQDLIGRVWCDRYEILEFVGRGGMGAVYKARQLHMDREVALKVIHRRLCRDEKQVQRFEQEARTSSRLHHPNSIRLYDYGKGDDGRLFMAMEFLRGRTLGRLVAEQGTVEPERVVHIARQIFKSLAEAHQLGLVHRDLKPENIFITDVHGEHDFVKVLDFGIAKAIGPSEDAANLTQTGFICGTPRYLSPEQALGQEVDARADLYAVGVLMYEMLTGRPPFLGENPISIVMKHVHDDPPPLTGMERYGLQGRRLTWLVERLLEKNPSRRPAEADRVVAWLDERLDESGLMGRPVPSLAGGAASRIPPFPGGREEPTQRRPAFDEAAAAPGPRGAFKEFVEVADEATVRRPAFDELAAPVPPPLPAQARRPPTAPTGGETELLPGEVLASHVSPGLPGAGMVPDPDQTSLIARPTPLHAADTRPAETLQLEQQQGSTRQMSLHEIDDAMVRAQAVRPPTGPVIRRRPGTGSHAPAGPPVGANLVRDDRPAPPPSRPATAGAARGSQAPTWALVLAAVSVAVLILSVVVYWWPVRDQPAPPEQVASRVTTAAPVAPAAAPAAPAAAPAEVAETPPAAAAPVAEAGAAAEAPPAEVEALELEADPLPEEAPDAGRATGAALATLTLPAEEAPAEAEAAAEPEAPAGGLGAPRPVVEAEPLYGGGAARPPEAAPEPEEEAPPAARPAAAKPSKPAPRPRPPRAEARKPAPKPEAKPEPKPEPRPAKEPVFEPF